MYDANNIKQLLNIAEAQQEGSKTSAFEHKFSKFSCVLLL